MPPEPKPPAPSSKSTIIAPDKGLRIFTYPKVVFMYPTMIVALICGFGMLSIHDTTVDPHKTQVQAKSAAPAATTPAAHERFQTPQNIFAVLFLGVFAFNLLMMALDFPRFTIVAGIFLAGFVIFFILWLGIYLDLLSALRSVMAKIYVVANAEFYFMVALVLALIFVIIWASRWLDYWQILPNEILHHHGPLSDLERYPTMNLKFDKEIPDILEFMVLGAGRLVLHVTDERKSIVLDNVLFINSVERALKNLMSRMEVRVTTDQEVAEL
jgi:hypothetical protein